MTAPASAGTTPPLSYRPVGQLSFEIDGATTIGSSVELDPLGAAVWLSELPDGDALSDTLQWFARMTELARHVVDRGRVSPVTDANEDSISHNIFYTAITRAREDLRICWTPETEHSILSNLQRHVNKKDAALLASRRGLAPMP
ncbi:MAG: hypothetical protein AAGA42_12795 [Actinomycetota bacterium]